MAGPAEGVEVTRAIDSILVGNRHRKDFGNIGQLAESIAREGLLQPLTVTPDGVLVCGARRLEALKRLGYKTVRVWVRGGVSDELSALIGEREDNVSHKPLTSVEAGELYAELTEIIREDAGRRQQATQFKKVGETPESTGGGDSPPPQFGGGKTREQAARMVTGHASYHMLEQVNEMRAAATDESLTEAVRAAAADGIDAIENGAPVSSQYAPYREILAVESGEAPGLSEPEPDPMQATALEALRRAKEARARGKKNAHRHDGPRAVRHPIRAFMATWEDLDGWWLHYDPEEIAHELSDQQWTIVEGVLVETNRFMDAARAARQAQLVKTA